MNRLRAWIRNFFGFSRTETNAFLILIPLMLIMIYSEPVYRFWFVRQPKDFSKESRELDSLMATWRWETKDSTSTEVTEEKLFSFDPNRVSHDQLVQLGFGKGLANRLINYRNKGGKFRTKKDLMKTYGLDSALYQKLFPFIDLPDHLVEEKKKEQVFSNEKRTFEPFDLNKSDTIRLKKIYGIGSVLSRRIVAYREKLGGFVSKEQLKEVYGLDSTALKELDSKSFIDVGFVPEQLDVNKASEKELGSHPYIRYKLAKLITAYRHQHGAFQSTDDLKKIVMIDTQRLRQLKPYLTIKP